MRTGLVRISVVISSSALAVLSLGAVSAASLAAVPQTIPTGFTYIVMGYTSGAYLWHSSDYMIATFGPHAEIKPKITENSCSGSTKQKWNSTKQSDGAWKITNVYDGSGFCMTEGSVVGDDIEMKSCGQDRQGWVWDVIPAPHKKHKHRSGVLPGGALSGVSQRGARPAW